MNYTKLFYWLTVADNAKSFFVVGIIIFTILIVISMIIFIAERDGQDLSAPVGGPAERAKVWLAYTAPWCVLFWSLYIFTPSKKDALFIVAGGQIVNFMTNDSTSKAIPHEAMNFVLTELKGMAKDAEVDLGISTQKDKILDQAKKMTANELMEKMKIDTTFARIVLSK